MCLKYLIYYLILNNFFNTVFSFTNSSLCRAYEWQCESGECIYADHLCDGVYHCDDGSDETADHCIHLPCPAYAFRCAYGACITGNNKCNGHQDCVDNSDETDFLCAPNVHELERTIQGNCGSSQLVQCKSGQCIESDERCDGVYNCEDHSDETVQFCSYLFCPSYAFRCGYGGCIRGSAKCDGIYNCVDGSDEALDLCGYDRGHKINATLPGSIVSFKSKDREYGCLIPFTLKAMDAQNIDTKQYLLLGTVVTPYSFVRFSCDKHYVLEGVPLNECVDKSWKYPFPTCTKYCPQRTIHKGISTTVSCVYNHHPVNCSSYLRKHTIANIRCAAGYKMPPKGSREHVQLRCGDNHEWDYPKLKCVPKCGILENPNVRLSETPWHVSIYEKENNFLRRSCGGTIISPKLVIAAAKCFTTLDPFYYNILLGHQQLILQQNDLIDKEVHNLSDIFITPDDFHGNTNDLAFATLLDYFDFGKPNIMPICLVEGDHARADSSVPSTKLYYPKELNKAEIAKLGDFDIGFGFSGNSATHKILRGIVSEIYGTERRELLLINVYYHRDFIKKAIRKYRYIL